MKRIPEPELMDDPLQARAYAEADFSEANTLFLERFARLHPTPPGHARVLDLGCGPGDITLDFARRYPDCHITAIDGAEAMLTHARTALRSNPALEGRIRLERLRLPCANLPRQAFDIILSNSLLHHLDDPGVMWRTIRECARPGATILVMDLARPASVQALDALVATYAADAPEVLRTDFRNSLYAAYEPEEVEEQLRSNGMQHLRVTVVSDRHFAVEGRL